MDELILEIQTLLKDAIAGAEPTDPLSKIKKVYYGDPVLIAKTFSPALIIMPGAENITSRGNKKDQDLLSLKISYYYNIKDSFWKDDSERVTWIRDAIILFWKRTCKAGSFDEKSIIGILRKNFYANSSATLQNNISINYNFELVEGTPVFKADLQVSFLIIANI